MLSPGPGCPVKASRRMPCGCDCTHWLTPGQLSAHTGVARRCEAVVNDGAAQQVREDQRQDCPPRPLRNFSDGRGGGATRSVPGNPECGRRTPSVATDPMLSARLSAGDARPNLGYGAAAAPFLALAAPQGGRRAVTDEILVKRLERALRSSYEGGIPVQECLMTRSMDREAPRADRPAAAITPCGQSPALCQAG
jgi:hypothetical protein